MSRGHACADTLTGQLGAGLFPNSYEPGLAVSARASLRRIQVDARIRLLLRMIDECHGLLPGGSQGMGKLLGLSEARLRRLFCAQVGKRLGRYLLEARMARAADWVKDEALPLKEIAAKCGYGSASNFSRDFRRVHAASPLEMRRAHLSSQFEARLAASKQ